MRRVDFIIAASGKEGEVKTVLSLIPDPQNGTEREVFLQLARERGDYEVGGNRLIPHEGETMEDLEQLVRDRMPR